MAERAVVYPNVVLGRDVVVEPFCVIGQPPLGAAPGAVPTSIGDGAIIRSGTVIYAGNRIGRRFATGHNAVIRESNEIGDDVSVGTLACVEHHVRIGNGVRLHSQCFVPEFCELQDGSWVGPNAVLTNAKYPRSADAKRSLRGVTLEAGAMVGANATILPGLRIGQGALVGAGSVVTRDVPSRMVVAGNPARVISRLDELQAYRSEGSR